MRNIAIYSVAAVLLLATAGTAAAQTSFLQGLNVTPSTAMPNETVTITCFSEPAHPLGTNGLIIVTDPFGNVVLNTGTLPFALGDFNGNGVQDNSLTVTFTVPAGAPPGQYIIFCDFWSGPSPGLDRGEATPTVGAYWQYLFVSFQVVPESIIGAVAPVAAGLAAFAGYRHYSSRGSSR